MRKPSLVPQRALLEFLQQYKRTPTACGSPQVGYSTTDRSPPGLTACYHHQHGQQTKLKAASKSLQSFHNDKVGDPCCTLYFGPKRTQDPRWIPVVVVKRTGTRTVQVRPIPRGGIWRRHIDQLRPRYPQDDEPRDEYSFTAYPDSADDFPDDSVSIQQPEISPSVSSPLQSPAYCPGNPRRSKQKRRPKEMFGVVVTDY